MLTEIPSRRNWPLDLDLFTQRHLCVFQTQEQTLPAGGVVLLQHALLCSSFDWVNQSPSQSLGFILADSGLLKLS